MKLPLLTNFFSLKYRLLIHIDNWLKINSLELSYLYHCCCWCCFENKQNFTKWTALNCKKGSSVKVIQFHCSLQWRHNERDRVSNHLRLECLLNRLFRRRSEETLKLRVTGLCEGNSPVTSAFLAQRASNAENASIWWRHHAFPFNVHPRPSCRFMFVSIKFSQLKIMWFSGSILDHAEILRNRWWKGRSCCKTNPGTESAGNMRKFVVKPTCSCQVTEKPKRIAATNVTLNKMAIFCQYFQTRFLEWKPVLFHSNSSEVCFNGSVDDISLLVQVMAWHRASDKSLPEPMMTQFTDTSVHRYVLIKLQIPWSL